MVSVDSVKFGEIVVDRKTYYSDLIVWWDGRVEMRSKSHEFGMEEFLHLLERNPEKIVVGTGTEGVLEILPEVSQVAEDRKIDIFSDTSSKAAEIFNMLVAKGKKAVAILHSTC